MKKTAEDIIILHKCTKNDNHEVGFLRYGKRQTFLSFWAIFCPFTPLENQNFEKMKKASGDVIILHMCTKNHDLGKMQKIPGDIILLPMCTINEDHMMYGS